MKYVILIVAALVIAGCDKKIHEARMPGDEPVRLASVAPR